MKKFFLALLTAALMMQIPFLVGAEEPRPAFNAESIAVPPTVDGAITEAEWGAPVVTFTPNSKNTVINLESTSDADQAAAKKALPSEAKLYLRWDIKYLYVGLQVTDDVYYNPNTDDKAWAGDSFECDIGANLDDQSVRFRTNIALSQSDGKTYANVYNKPNYGYAAMMEAFDPISGECKAARSGNVTTYEIAYLWADYTKSGSADAGYQFYLNSQIHVANGTLHGTESGFEAYLGYMRYGVKSDDGVLFPLITLTGTASGSQSSNSQTTASVTSTSGTVASTTAAASKSTAAAQSVGTKETEGMPGYILAIIIVAAVVVVGAAVFGIYVAVKKKSLKK